MPSKPLEFLLLPFLFVFLVVGLDTVVTQTVIAGPVFIAALGLMAFRFPALWIAIWSLVFFIVYAQALLTDQWFISTPNMELRFLTRSSGFLISATIAALLASRREQLVRNHQQLLSLLLNMPIPVIVADADGTIAFSNKRAASLLLMEPEDLVGQSFFSKFTDPSNRGRQLETYFEWFDSSGGRTKEEIFVTQISPPQAFTASMCVAELRQKVMVIALTRVLNHDDGNPIDPSIYDFTEKIRLIAKSSSPEIPPTAPA